jgi:hypothetical protein
LFSSGKAIRALISVALGAREPGDLPPVPGALTDLPCPSWTAFSLLPDSKNLVDRYLELAADAARDPASLEVLLAVSVLKVLFPLLERPLAPYTTHSRGGCAAECSYLAAVRPMLGLPFQGTAPFYGRAHLWIDDAPIDRTYPDCVETSTQQIVSVLFLELSGCGWRFDTDAIRATAARPDLAAFFAGIQPSDLTDSSMAFATKWARVMAGLKGGGGIPAPIENEVRAGLTSQVRAFAALFQLQSDVRVEMTVDEVAGEFERLLNSVNPRRKCSVTVVEWWEAEVVRPKQPIPQKEFEETHRLAAALLLRETESIGHSEIITIRTFAEGFAVAG